MVVREFGWGRLVLGLMLGLVALGSNAVAQEEYVGDRMCKVCHAGKYAAHMKHGHAWIEVPTGGQEPGLDLFGFASVGVGLPDPTTYKDASGNSHNLTWDNVAALLGNFKEGHGYFVRASDGKRISNGSNAGVYPARCFKCHNPTGYTPTGTMYGIPGWANGAPASDPNGKPLQGIQCEHCHGPAATMAIPDRTLCTNCHSRTDDAGDPNHRIPFAPTADGKSGVFTNRHAQGDEYRRSPHKDVDDGIDAGCALCHSPHKSVWHDGGGVRFSSEDGIGNMCKHCHVRTNPAFPNAKKVRIRGAMGEIGLECVDCHMPEKSEGSAVAGVAVEPLGHRATHLFRINPTALKATDNVTLDGTSKYWNSPDPTDPTNPTALNGDSFLTLDMVCTDCHSNMTLAQMAKAAKGIHRQPGLVDLTVNNGDGLQLVKRTDQVSVDFSLEAGVKKDMKADWWVLSQGPKGWTSWDGKKWKAGLRPWRKNVALADVPQQNVLKAKLAPGYYTYWVSIAPTDGSMNFDGVLVYVTR